MNSDEYGIYIRDIDSKEYLFYFGIWYPLWKEKGLPLCFGVSLNWANDLVNNFTKKYHDSMIEYNGFMLSSVNKEILNDDENLDKIKEQIRDTLESLKL